MNRITRLVVERELRATFSRRSFRIILAIVFVLSVGLAVLPELLDSDGPSQRDLVTIGDVPAEVVDDATTSLEQFNIELDVTSGDDADELRDSIVAGDVDVGLVWGDEPIILRRGGDFETIVQVLQQSIRAMRGQQVFDAAGVTPEVVTEAASVPGATVEALDTDRQGRFGVASILTVVLYMAILVLANVVASSVASEKSNRVSEVLLAVSPSRRLLYGKVIAAVVTGLTMLAAAAIPQAVKLIFFGGSLPGGLADALVVTFPWFIGGAALYLLIAACMGATVERTEEVGTVMMPLTMLLVGVYLVSFATLESGFGVVLSIVPLSSPIVLPARMAFGVASPLEVIVSLVALVAAVFIIARIATVLYGRAIVRTGRRLKLTDLRHR